MHTEELFEVLSQIQSKAQVQHLAAQANSGKLPVADLLRLCYTQHKPAVAFRAAWVLEEVAHTYPEQFVPHLPDFVSQLSAQHNLSCQRHFTKILMCCANPKARPIYSTAWSAIPEHEAVVETMFEWLIDPRTPVAVKVNCLDVLAYLQDEFPWIKDELKAQIEFLLKDGSPAMLSRGKRLLKRFFPHNR
ncbi:hypothetical protein [Pontibacter sp. HSC-36F09]|uniref:hypothetical protein n=1 Tax=Pontibacter sp. HSC-36F09 TaxID=2910966 RepID=UPI00209CB127|nr:hypothetical protein [Pontibacter sp. HSC-36F09]MCP2043936.1 hypothetical protein [Pontibacter sp. HSC-36F09]